MTIESFKAPRAQYLKDSYVHLRGIVSQDLLDELRQTALKGRDFSRREKSHQLGYALKPIWEFHSVLGDTTSFDKLARHPALNEAVSGVITKDARADTQNMYLYYDHPHTWCGPWHRDTFFIIQAGDGNQEQVSRYLEEDPHAYATIYIPLNPDRNLWYVPGSTALPDTSEQMALYEEGQKLDMLEGPFQGKSEPERRRICLDYLQKMPGAVNFCLDPGDLLFFSAHAWHVGLYQSDDRRMTLGCSVLKTTSPMRKP